MHTPGARRADPLLGRPASGAVAFDEGGRVLEVSGRYEVDDVGRMRDMSCIWTILHAFPSHRPLYGLGGSRKRDRLPTCKGRSNRPRGKASGYLQSEHVHGSFCVSLSRSCAYAKAMKLGQSSVGLEARSKRAGMTHFKKREEQRRDARTRDT